jgi:hypothetical protein
MKVKFLNAAVVGVILSTSALSSIANASLITLMDENFESIVLNKYINESNGDGTDFATNGPSGWAKDNSGVVTPTGTQSIEFYGFTFLDIDSWIGSSGNQERDQFTKGGVGSNGTIMVADPDEFDDQTDLGRNNFNAYITTQTLDLAGLADSTLSIMFDSSFRPYNGMLGTLEVSFDNGAFENLLTLNNSNSGGQSSLNRINETLTLNVNNVGAATAKFRFGLANADNDWWWAVDNIKVVGDSIEIEVPEPFTLAIFALGMIGLTSRLFKKQS